MNKGIKIGKTLLTAIERKDFKTFASFCKIYSDFEFGYIRLHYDNWLGPQKKFEENRCGRDIVLKPRRVGFTTLELARDIFFAFCNPGSTTLVVSQNKDLSRKIIMDISMILDGFYDIEKEFKMKVVPQVILKNSSFIQFDNGSKIQVEIAKASEMAATNTGRGIGINRLHCTEVAFWVFPKQTMESLLNAARTAKEIVIESTANGASGYFYETYYKVKKGKMNGWKHHFYPWFEHNQYFLPIEKGEKFDTKPQNPIEVELLNTYKVKPTQLKWWRMIVQESSKGEEGALQEYPMDEATCFRTKSQTFLSSEDIKYLVDSVEIPVEEYESFNEKVRIYIPAIPGRRYIMGVDTAYGIGNDYHAFTIIDHITGEIACTYSANNITVKEFSSVCVEFAEKYMAMIVVENKATGPECINNIIEKNYYNLYRETGKDQYGLTPTENRKITMFNMLQEMIKQCDPKMPDIEINSECQFLVYKNGKVDHMKGRTSDRVLSFLIAQLIRREMPTISAKPYISIGQRQTKFQRFNMQGVSLK